MKKSVYFMCGCLALMALTGCGNPKFTIVLKGGETIVPEKVTRDDGSWAADDWMSEKLSPEEIECDPVAKALLMRGTERVEKLLTKQESEHGLRYRFYVAESCAWNREGKVIANPDDGAVIMIFCALALTNLSMEPIAIEKILAETEESLSGIGKMTSYAGRNVYCVQESEKEGTELVVFFMPLCDAELTIVPIEDEPREHHLKGVLPLNVTLAPNETRVFYAMMTYVRMDTEEDLQKALKLCYDYVQPLLARSPEGETK